MHGDRIAHLVVAREFRIGCYIVVRVQWKMWILYGAALYRLNGLLMLL